MYVDRRYHGQMGQVSQMEARSGANKIFFYFFCSSTDLNSAHREQSFKHT
jgi:hypothetical protein